jgi:hypothetical protein
MNKLKKTALLILGILVATFSLMFQVCYGGTSSTGDHEEVEYQLVEEILNEIEVEKNSTILQDDLYKIFNNDNKLVFETRNSEDQKLKNLLNKSDLLTTINNIYYYKLSR